MTIEQINIQDLFNFMTATNTILLFAIVVIGKGVLSAIQYYKAGQFEWKALFFGIVEDFKYMVVAYTFYVMFVATGFEWFMYAFRLIGAYFISIESVKLIKSLDLQVDSEVDEQYEFDIENVDENFHKEFGYNESDNDKQESKEKSLYELGVD